MPTRRCAPRLAVQVFSWVLQHIKAAAAAPAAPTAGASPSAPRASAPPAPRLSVGLCLDVLVVADYLQARPGPRAPFVCAGTEGTGHRHHCLCPATGQATTALRPACGPPHPQMPPLVSEVAAFAAAHLPALLAAEAGVVVVGGGGSSAEDGPAGPPPLLLARLPPHLLRRVALVRRWAAWQAWLVSAPAALARMGKEGS
jgi:hypothetical protein